MAFPLNSTSVAHANDNAKPDEYVVLSSGLLLMYELGAIAGPIVASVVMSMTGPGGLFTFSALVHGTLFLYIMNRMLRSSRPPTGQHVPFDDALKVSRTTSQVHEREIE